MSCSVDPIIDKVRGQSCQEPGLQRIPREVPNSIVFVHVRVDDYERTAQYDTNGNIITTVPVRTLSI